MIEVQVSQELDRRYRVLVVLARSDRPTHYTWHCPRCTMPVAELVNMEVRALSDIMDVTSHELIGVRCDGRTGHGRCNTWYYWSLT